MDLNRLAVRARLRTPWESIDLGIALARAQWWPLFLVWLLPAALVFGGLALTLWDSPTLCILIVWWLKPVYDRLPLYIASRALFGERVSAGAALRKFFSQNRHDLLPWISWRRLSSTRSFDMPVTMLEQSRGAARSARIGVLHRKSASAATWLTLTGVHLELFLSIGLLTLIYLFIPDQLEVDWLPLLGGGEVWLEWLLNGLYLLVMAAVAPFYVLGGFALYIGRRIELEAWDIEIQFRNLVERHKRERKTAGRRSAPAAAQLLLLCALGLAAAAPAIPVRAEAVDTPPQAQQAIDEILAGEDFHQVEKEHGWRLKDRETQQEQFPEWLIALLEWLEEHFSGDSADDSDADLAGLGPLIGTLIEILLWGGAALLLIYILWRFREPLRQSLAFRREQKPQRSAPETLFGLDVRRSSLPADVCGEVLRLWADGEQRASLGLLYRATLSHLIERYQFEFGDQLTEGECAQLVLLRQREADSERPPVGEFLGGFVQQLTAVWQQLAYAHRAPESPRVHTLCDQWREAFVDER